MKLAIEIRHEVVTKILTFDVQKNQKSFNMNT